MHLWNIGLENGDRCIDRHGVPKMDDSCCQLVFGNGITAGPSCSPMEREGRHGTPAAYQSDIDAIARDIH